MPGWCVLSLLFGFAALRVSDPAPLEELRLRTFDIFQVIEPRVKTSGRSSSSISTRRACEARPVAVAADAHRRHDHQSHPARRGRDRLRHRVRRAGPAVPPSPPTPFRDLDEETRDKLRALPSNDQVLADAIKQSRVVLGEIRPAHVFVPQPDEPLPVTRRRDARRRSAAVPVQFPGPAAKRPGARERRGRARPVQHPPERDGIVRRVPMVMQAQGNDHAVAVVRDAAGRDRRQHHPDQDGQGRHQERRRAGSRDADRPQRPALGAFRAARSRRVYVSARRCAGRPRRRRTACRASWC